EEGGEDESDAARERSVLPAAKLEGGLSESLVICKVLGSLLHVFRGVGHGCGVLVCGQGGFIIAEAMVGDSEVEPGSGRGSSHVRRQLEQPDGPGIILGLTIFTQNYPEILRTRSYLVHIVHPWLVNATRFEYGSGHVKKVLFVFCPGFLRDACGDCGYHPIKGQSSDYRKDYAGKSLSDRVGW